MQLEVFRGKGISVPMSESTRVADVCVIGLGYIGLPTAAFFARTLSFVVGVDIDTDRVNLINGGQAPFVENGLEELITEVIESGSLEARNAPVVADVFVIAVPTPVNEDHTVDLSYIRSAVDSVAPFLRGNELIILESTVPPGTTAEVEKFLYETRPDLKELSLDIAHCPERVLPGNIMAEMVSNDRVAGGLTERAAARARDLYKEFCEGEVLTTDARTAEMTKLTENTFRDVNIAFANELSLICDKLGVNVWELIELANRHPRVNILQPGPGVGGHCIAVDPWFIASAAPLESPLIQTARQVNDGKPHYVVGKVQEVITGIENPKLVVLGITFKPNVDDLRESPAVEIVNLLAQKNPTAEIIVVDPHVKNLPDELKLFPTVKHTNALPETEDADVVVLLVDHRKFGNLTLGDLGSAPLIDTRGVFEREISAHG